MKEPNTRENSSPHHSTRLSSDLQKSQDKLVPRARHNTRQLTQDMHGVYLWCF